MDYQGEQEMELEALQAILMDDLQELDDGVPQGWDPPGPVYRILLSPKLEDDEVQADIPVQAELVFAHTPTYPETSPLLRARGVSALSDADVAMLQTTLDKEVKANLGMAMIYTLVSVAQEWVNEKALQAAAPSTDPALLLRKEQEAEEARRAALRAHGTPVTPETFLAWQEAFAAERALSSTAITEGVHAGAAQRLSGKKYFQMQESKHLQVEEEPSGSDEEGWDVPLERQGGAGDEDVDFDEEESSDDELLLEELAAGRGVQ